MLVERHPFMAHELKRGNIVLQYIREGLRRGELYAPAAPTLLHRCDGHLMSTLQVEVPHFGGDTLFVSMAAAYEALSSAMQRFLDGLTAVHSSRHVFGASIRNTEAATSGRLGNAEAATQDARHPVVITHPLSGRLGLYVNPVFTTHF